MGDDVDKVSPEARAAGWIGENPPPNMEKHSPYVEPLQESDNLDDFLNEDGTIKPMP